MTQLSYSQAGCCKGPRAIVDWNRTLDGIQPCSARLLNSTLDCFNLPSHMAMTPLEYRKNPRMKFLSPTPCMSEDNMHDTVVPSGISRVIVSLP